MGKNTSKKYGGVKTSGLEQVKSEKRIGRKKESEERDHPSDLL